MVAVVIVVACALIVDADPVAVAVNENATSLQVPSVRQSLQPWLLLLLLVMMMQVLTYVSNCCSEIHTTTSENRTTTRDTGSPMPTPMRTSLFPTKKPKRMTRRQLLLLASCFLSVSICDEWMLFVVLVEWMAEKGRRVIHAKRLAVTKRI
jgi:hypothetical protein